MESPVPLQRLVGVYNAEGSLKGELSYWVGKRLGRAHCALCDITHGTFRERGDWKACRAELPVPFETYHLDDQPSDVRQLIDGRTPAVVAFTSEGPTLLLEPTQIEACAGTPERLVVAMRSAAHERGIIWP